MSSIRKQDPKQKGENLNSYCIGLKRKHQNKTIRFAFCFSFDTAFVFFDEFPWRKRQRILFLFKNVPKSI
jgi:hypothetical protein